MEKFIIDGRTYNPYTSKLVNSWTVFIHAMSQMKSWSSVPDGIWKTACKVAGIKSEDTASETFEAFVNLIT